MSKEVQYEEVPHDELRDDQIFHINVSKPTSSLEGGAVALAGKGAYETAKVVPKVAKYIPEHLMPFVFKGKPSVELGPVTNFGAPPTSTAKPPIPTTVGEFYNPVMVSEEGIGPGAAKNRLHNYDQKIGNALNEKWLANPEPGFHVEGNRMIATPVGADLTPTLKAPTLLESMGSAPPPPTPLTPTQRAMQMVEGVGAKAAPALNFLTPALRTLNPAFVGLGYMGAGTEGLEAYKRFKHGDYGRALVDLAGGVGTLASIYAPHPLAKVLGLGAGLGAHYLNQKLDEKYGRNYREGGLVHLAEGHQPGKSNESLVPQVTLEGDYNYRPDLDPEVSLEQTIKDMYNSPANSLSPILHPESVIKGLGSAGESLGRGVGAAIPGVFGDFESLGRGGLNYIGTGRDVNNDVQYDELGNPISNNTSYGESTNLVNPHTALPTTEDYLKMLPRATPKFGDDTANSFLEGLGGFLSPLAFEKASPYALKGAKALGQTAAEKMMSGEPWVKGAEFLNPPILPITAWHGTPHKIEGGFDLAKVGTGEGNQTFGHGMYFAQNPDIAKTYRHELSVKSPIDRMMVNMFKNRKMAGLTDEEAIKQTKKWATHEPQLGPKKADSLEQVLQQGNLYKVDIPDEQIPKMLDLDKPISEQMHVWEALHPDVRKAIDDLMETQFRNPISEVPEAYTGYNLYRALTHHDVGEVLPPELPNSNWFKGDTSYEKHASQYLNSLGIPGIKYLDQGSRGNAPIVRKVNVLDPETNTYTKEQYEVDPRWHEPNKKYYFPTEEEAKTHADSYGTRNFVSFDPTTVKILEENDVPKFAKGGPTENSNNQSASQMTQKQFSVQGIPLKPSDDESYQSWWTDASKQNDMNRYANAMLPSKDLNISNPSYLKGVESITNYPGGHITGQLGFYKPFIDGSNINVTSDLNEKEAPYVTGHEAQHLQDNLAFFNQWGDEKNYSFLNRLDRGAAKTNSKPYEEQIEKNYQDYVKKWKKEEDENPNKSYYGSSRFRANEELGNYYDRTPGFNERFADFAGLEAALPRGARLADTPLGKAVFNTPELQNYYNLNTRPLEIKAMPGNSPTSPTADALRKIKAELKLHFGNSNESYVDALINTIKHSLK